MKKLAMLILEDNQTTEKVFAALTNNGFNGTLIPSTSLKHALNNAEEIPMFFSLSNIENSKMEANSTILIVVDETQINSLKSIIKEITNNFTDDKGAFFVLPIESFEGSI